MLDEKKLTEAVHELHGQKKGFSQSFDLVFAFKDLNLKNPQEQVEFFATMPHSPGKKTTVCALVGPEMIDDAKVAVDLALEQVRFEKMTKPEIRKIAAKYDYFLGQANIMPKIAASFGRVLGPRGKMPNPKAGCIVPPKAPLKPLVERLQRTVKISAKKSPSCAVRVGSQSIPADQVVENVRNLYDQVVHHLPKEENNVKAVYLKVTMGHPVRLK